MEFASTDASGEKLVSDTTSSIQEDLKQTRPFPSRSQETYVALLRTADDSKRFLSQLLDAEDVTLQQYNVLRILRDAGDERLPTLSVAERMVERTPGVTRLIDRMERKDWVLRTRCVEDRRRVWCTITDEGRALLDRLDAPVEAVDDVLQSALSDKELASLTKFLDRIRARLAQSEAD